MFLRVLLFLCISFPAFTAELPMSIFGGKDSEKSEPLSKETIKEVKDLISTLENRGKREQLVKALKVLTVVSKVKEPQENFVAQLTKSAAEKLEYAANLSTDALIALVQFPIDLFTGFSNLANHEIRGTFFKFLMKLLLILGCAAAFEISLYYIFNRWNFTRDLHQKPLATRVILGFAPLGVFTLIGGILIPVLSDPPISSSHASIFITIVLFRVLWFASLVILSPRHEESRLVKLNNEEALKLHGWFLTLGQITILGHLITLILQYTNLPSGALNTWTNLLTFIIALVFLGFVNRYREKISQWFRLDDLPEIESSGRVFIVFMSILARTWYSLLILLVLGIVLSSSAGASETFYYIQHAGLLSIALICAVILLSRTIHRKTRAWIQEMNLKPLIQQGKRGFLLDMKRVAHTLMPAAQLFLFTLTILGLLHIWDFDLFQVIHDESIRDIVIRSISIVIILWLTRVLWAAWNMIINYQMKPITLKGRTLEPSILVKTLGPIIRTLGHVGMFIAAFVLVLQQLSVNVLPLFYGFGIVGIAFGIGAQDLAKDLINGVLILLEGNLAVGEGVIIGGHAGIVEKITPRSVFLRHSNGHLQNIPFSEVKNIINKSRDFTVAKIMVSVEFETPIEKVTQALEETLEEIKANHPVYGKMIKSPLKFLGVHESFEHGYTYVCSVRTSPDPSGDFVYEFYRQWKVTSDKHHISQPVQRQQVEVLRDLTKETD